MICIIKIQDDPCKSGPIGCSAGGIMETFYGWIIANDIDDAITKSDAACESELSDILYRMRLVPESGRLLLGDKYILLVT